MKGDMTTQITIPADLFYFDGHFPHNPVLPAVAIIDLSVDFLKRSQAPQNMELQEVVDAKFSQPVRPNSTINLEVTLINTTQNLWQVVWKDTNNLDVFAQLRIGLRTQ